MAGNPNALYAPYEDQTQNPTPTPRDEGTGLQTVSSPGYPVGRVNDTPDISGLYQAILGRAPDARELASESENLGKYGAAQLEANLKERAASNGQGVQGIDRQSAQGNALYGSGTGNTTNTPGGPLTGYRPGGASGSAAPAFQNTSPQFDDPSQRLIEDYALDRFRQLQNPDPNSGTALFEKYARKLIDTLRGPVYSAGDEAVIKGKALDTIMGEQDRTIQQWMEQLSRRGIPPSSGPALEGIRQIQDHYKRLRTQVEADFARDAIAQTRTQRQQVLSTAGQLAGSEQSRLNAAGTYAAMPYGLTQDAFQRNLQLVGAGGNPASLVQSLLGVANANQASDYYSSQQRQQLAGGLLQLLGYMTGA